MEKEWLDGYKVCKREGNRFVSCFIGTGKGREDWGFKVYRIGHITKRSPGYIRGVVTRLRKYGPLAVFKHINMAISYINYDVEDPLVVFKCRYIKSTDDDLWLPGYRQRRLNRFARIAGTYYADEVELVEEVEVDRLAS